MRFLFLLLFGLTAALTLTAENTRAQDNSVVLELYTSQGCSSCPPADALLPELARLPGVIALALHVSYWDYLGWKDSFGLESNTARQRDYNRARASRSVYTPQMIVQGVDVIVGHHAREIQASIAAHRSKPAPIAFQARRHGDIIDIAVGLLDGNAVGEADIHIVRFDRGMDVNIRAGENAGRRIMYTNIVKQWDTVTQWNGRTDRRLRVKTEGDLPVVVIVQRAGNGPILAARELY